jgi:cysteine desulfurase
MLAKHFFTIRKTVYLDNNATTAVAPCVYKKMQKVLKKNFGNPSSLYKEAIDSAIILDESRLTIAKTINANVDEVYFTGCATESNNTIIKTLAEKAFPEKRKILSTPIEHTSVISTLEYLKTKGFEIEYIPIDAKGRIIISAFESLLNESVFLVCCIFANNETGVIQDVKQITAISHKHNIPVFSDCVQALGKILVDVKDLNIDYASFSAHKIHGPKGCGALYVKEGAYIQSFIHGGHQENGLRAGTESLHNIAGFAEACKLVPSYLEKVNQIGTLKTHLIECLQKIKPDILVSSPEVADCLPNTVNIVFPGISNAYLIATLDYFNIAVSAGSACNTQSNEPSHVLKAIGLTDEQARESIRFSLGHSITKTQIDYTLNIIKEFVTGKFPPVGMLEPKVLNEEMLFNPDTYVLDVRFWHDRFLVKSIPNSVEIPFFSFKKYLKHVPRDKNIVVVCQGGFNSPVVAYELKFKGYERVSFLILGILAWKQTYPELYEKFGNYNIQKKKE